MAQGFWGPAPLRKSVHRITWCHLSSVPSGDRSANPVSVPGRSGLQRALLSVSSAQILEPGPSGVSRAARSAVSCRSPASGHRASRSKYTRGQSWETGSLSRSPGGVGAPAKHLSLGPTWADSGSLVFLRDDAGLRTVVSNRRLLRQSWCHGPERMRAGPSGGTIRWQRFASHSWLFCSLAIAVLFHTRQGFASLAAWISRSPCVRRSSSSRRGTSQVTYVTMVPRANETLRLRAILPASLLELCFSPRS